MPSAVRTISERLREIPIWLVRDMRPGWQEHGTAAYEAADLLQACEPFLKMGETPAQRIERERADNEALLILLAKARKKGALK